MTTILFAVIIAFVFAASLTPMVRWFAHKRGYLDYPNERKHHEGGIPRIGGVGIVLSFFMTLGSFLFFPTDVIRGVFHDPRCLYLFGGALIVFGMGLVDDIIGLPALKKLVVQIIAALLACYGGLKITVFAIPGGPVIEFGWFWLPVTVFWILFVINGINLIDGLDGLASGVSLFTCIVLLILCILGGRVGPAFLLAVLSGAIMGFLLYNFNPASIFMGDSGSYFLGYMLATLSILGSMKSQAAAVIFIPVVALGLPLMDTVFSTMRRFVTGKRIFAADSNHFHHRLIKMGYSQRRAVLVMYAMTIFFGAASLLMVGLRDDRNLIVLAVIGAGIVILIKRLGYLDGMTGRSLAMWGERFMDAFPIRRERRIFMGHQMDLLASRTLMSFWTNVQAAVEDIDIDYLRIKLLKSGTDESYFDRVLMPAEEVGREERGVDGKSGLYVRYMILCGEDTHVELSFCKTNMVNQGSLVARRIDILKETIIQWVSRYEGLLYDTQITFKPKKIFVVESPDNSDGKPSANANYFKQGA